jgi:hypothetical protein
MVDKSLHTDIENFLTWTYIFLFLFVLNY